MHLLREERRVFSFAVKFGFRRRFFALVDLAKNAVDGRGPMRVLAVLVIAFPLTTRGGISRPDSSVTFSRDGTRMLVMRSWDPKYDDAPMATLSDGRVARIRDTFPKSGVYDSRTLQPLWQVDWYAHEWDLLCSDDLQHVARIDCTGYRRNSALLFYDNGKLIRSYACTDLLTGLRHWRFLPYSTWDWHEQWYQDFDLVASRTEVALSTARRHLYFCGQNFDLGLQESYRFDLETGSIYSRSVTGRWVMWAYGVAALLLVLAPLLVGRSLWRRMRRKKSLRRRGFEVVAGNL